jgi:membrane protein DedA with SNARE-associated domain
MQILNLPLYLLLQADSLARKTIAHDSNGSLTQQISSWATNLLDTTGYAGLVFLMALESMIAPIPSEAVMPFAGFLIVEGTYSWFGVIAFSTLGSIIGSLISYYLGYWGGRPIVLKVGKYFLLDKSHLDSTEKYFTKRGEITILIARFIPVVRHLISIPAGLAKMNIWKFLIYTIIGAGCWNTILAVAGYYLKDNWASIMTYSHIIDYFVVGILVLFFAYILWKLIKDYKKRQAEKKVQS